MKMDRFKIKDYSINKLLKRCQELEKRGFECVRRVVREDDKYTAVYKRIEEV